MELKQQNTQAVLIDAVIHRNELKNDAALARQIGVAPPVISKIRSGRLPVGPCFILKLHETFDMPVATIREYLAGAA